MKELLESWLAEDVGSGDLTSQAVVDNIACKAHVTGGLGIVSGIEVCKKLLEIVSVDYKTQVSDGDKIDYGELIFELSGKSYNVLKVERLLLNLLSHLSGVATLTNNFVKEAQSVNPKVRILATRKTLPGLRILEKEAVVHGGGLTHRMRLDDAILVKDNHLKLDADIEHAIISARKKHPNLMVEIEVDTSKQAIAAANFGADRVMLDNFSIEEVVSTVSKIRNFSNIEIEISGGINIHNVKQFAPHGDYISSSSLTMSAKPVDFSLHVV